MASVDRQDIMLLIADGADGPYPLDPIRLMKGCFIVDQIGPDDWKDLFAFERPMLLAEVNGTPGFVTQDRDGVLSVISLTAGCWSAANPPPARNGGLSARSTTGEFRGRSNSVAHTRASTACRRPRPSSS